MPQSLSFILVHIVFSTKYRTPCLVPAVRPALHAYLATVSRNAVWRQATLAARARWVNVDRWLCAKGVCPLVIGNVIVYTDQHHLTRTFARTLIPQLQGALKL